MNISEASRLSGLPVDTIRFYEKAGMLPATPRDRRGWRAFGAESVEWLCNLARLRATGMPLADVRRFAILIHRGDASNPDVIAERLDILERNASRLLERQAELDACKAYLNHKLGVYRNQQGSKR
jgi:DNA-binding transcriptional MerR regulator